MTMIVFAILKMTTTSSSFIYISVRFYSIVGNPNVQLRHHAAATEDSPRILGLQGQN